MANEVPELNQVRLEDDLTYDELGKAIGVDGSVLNRILNSKSREPHDRTLFKIRKFLDARRRGKSSKRRAVSA